MLPSRGIPTCSSSSIMLIPRGACSDWPPRRCLSVRPPLPSASGSPCIPGDRRVWLLRARSSATVSGEGVLGLAAAAADAAAAAAARRDVDLLRSHVPFSALRLLPMLGEAGGMCSSAFCRGADSLLLPLSLPLPMLTLLTPVSLLRCACCAWRLAWPPLPCRVAAWLPAPSPASASLDETEGATEKRTRAPVLVALGLR